MNTIGINTTQNISFRHSLASVGQRMLAFFLDLLIMGAYSLTMGLILAFQNFNSAALSILFSLPLIVYFPLSEILMNGQTIGKQALKIRVVKTDGSAPSVSAYLLRWLLLAVDVGLGGGGLAVMLIIFTKNGQRLGDLAAGTVVVQETKGIAGLKRDLATMEQLDENYQPEFPQAMKLNDDDLRLIKEATRAFRLNGVRKPMEILKPRLEEKMQLETVNMHELKFLDTLLKDYTYYSLRQAERE